MRKYRKAIVPIVTGLASVVAIAAGHDPSAWEAVAVAALTALGVYETPNARY